MLSAQAIDGNSSLGNAAAVYDYGFWAGATIPLGLVICLLLTGLIFGKRLNKLSMLTLPDFYYRRYGASVEGLSGILMIISFVVLVAGNFAASGFILKEVLGVSFVGAMLIAAAIVLTYTAFGGLFSCAYTDIFQIYLAVIGFWAMFIYFAGGFSGFSWHDFMANTPDGYLDLSGLTDRSNGALLNWATIISLGIGDLVALDFMERVFSARDGRTAARGAYWGAAVTLITVVPTAFVGIFALTLIPNASDPYLVYPDIAINHVPTWIGVLMCAGVLGAAMSTANGGILAISAVLSRNLVQRDIMGELLKKEHMGNQKLLRLVRLMLVPVVGGGFVLAWLKPQPGTYLVLAFDIVLAGALVPLVLGLFWKKANTPAALSTMIVGSVLPPDRLLGDARGMGGHRDDDPAGDRPDRLRDGGGADAEALLGRGAARHRRLRPAGGGRRPRRRPEGLHAAGARRGARRPQPGLGRDGSNGPGDEQVPGASAEEGGGAR